MSHSYQKIWVHTVWATKNRMPLIHQSFEQELYNFISEQLREQNCSVSIVNGVENHIHCLFLLNHTHSISEIIKQIKGSSSHFINQKNLCKHKFAWQTGYSAFSVSESVAKNVFRYIANQKVHHQKKAFQEEYDSFLKFHGFSNLAHD